MPAAWSVYFATDDIEADVERALNLGATEVYPTITVGDMGRMVACEDPTGAGFSLWQAATHVGTQVAGEPGSAAWYELYASDAKQARDFYTTLLGASADSMSGGMEYYVLKHGEQFGGIMQIDPTWGDLHPQWAIYFAVANADETAATIVAHGGKVLGSIDDSPFGRLAAAMDPSGAMFKILQLPG